MNEEKMRQLIREEMYAFYKISKYEFDKKIQIRDGKNIRVGRTNGTKIGTATDQKIGFWNTTPIVQPTAITDPDDAGATYSQAGVQTIVNKVKAILDALQATGLIDT